MLRSKRYRVHGGLREILAGERPLGRFEKRDEQFVFAFGKHDRISNRVCQFQEPSIELPAVEPVTALLQHPRRLTCGFVGE